MRPRGETDRTPCRAFADARARPRAARRGCGATSARALGAGSGAAAGPSPAPSFAATLPAPYAPAPFAPAPYAGGLSAGRALRGRALRGSLSALRLGSSPCPPPPPRPPLRWKRSRPGLRPRRGRFCALRPPFGGSPCWRQSCWRVRLWLGPRRGPRPFAAPRRPCAPRKFALPACVPACGGRPRGPPWPSGPRWAARRWRAVPSRSASSRARLPPRGSLPPLCSEGPRYAGRAVAAIAAFFVRPSGAPAGRSGLPRARPHLGSVGRLRRLRRPRGALPSRPARRALRLPCLRFGLGLCSSPAFRRVALLAKHAPGAVGP